MKRLLISEKAKAILKWLVVGLFAILLFVWLQLTPGGLLGKADAIAYAICHRIAERSFYLGDRQLPLCARCTGMYLGALLGLIYQFTRSGRRGRMPPMKVMAIFAASLAAFGIDGVNSYLHFFPGAPSLYAPQNWLRLATGSLMGLALAGVVYPAFVQTIWRDWVDEPAISSFRQLGELGGLGTLVAFFVLWGNPLLLYPLALFSVGGALALLLMVYTMVWVMVLHSENIYARLRQLWFPLLAGALTTLLQVSVLDLGRFIWTGTWGGFKL